MGIGGRSALDFLIKVDGYKFIDALQYLNDITSGKENKPLSNSLPEKKALVITVRASNEDKAKIYLSSCGISKIMIDYHFNNHRIYQTDKNNNDGQVYSNVCFLGYDSKINLPRHISMRGIGTDFIGDALSSDKHYSIYIQFKNKECNIVHITEGAIDTLSLATLFEMDGRDFNQQYILLLTGIAVPQKENAPMKIPIALEQFIYDHPKTDTIVFHFDLDKVGRKVSYLIQKNIKKSLAQYQCFDEPPKHYKDINDSLCI